MQSSGARRTLSADPEAAIEAAKLIERTAAMRWSSCVACSAPCDAGKSRPSTARPAWSRSRRWSLELGSRACRPRFGSKETPVELGAGADMAAYRLVQEALTNALKHAGSSTTEVA